MRHHSSIALLATWLMTSMLAVFLARPARADDAQDVRDAILNAVKSSDPKGKYQGVTWSPWRNDTQFDSDWLLATPGVWGVSNPLPRWMSPGEPATCSGTGCNTDVRLPLCDPSRPTACAATGTACVASAATVTKPGDSPVNVCMSPADRMVDEVYKAVAGATATVDITSLLPMDGRFMFGFSNALTYLANTGRSVTIRFLYGNIPFYTTEKSVATTIQWLVGRAKFVAGSKLTVYAGYLRSGTLAVTGWNHAKIIIIDSAKVLVGGENWVADDYLQKDPVFDLNMKLRGQVAADATGFVNALWNDLCAHNYTVRRRSMKYSAVAAGVGHFFVFPECLKTLPADVRPGGGSAYTMAVGRLGEIDYSNGAQSTAALVALIGAARHDILISQQDIEGPSNRWPDDFLNALADQLIAGRDVHIVQSSDDAGSSTSGYSNGTLVELADKLRSTVNGRKNAPRKAMT
jgi:hypothetical protein